MNKKGVTILELLISISLISIIILMLVKVMFSLDNINNSKTYASSDEISRTEIIKTIESDFLKLKLKGLTINENSEETIFHFLYENQNKDLIIKNNELTYDNLKYPLKSPNATYSLCPSYKYLTLENNYYYLDINIPVLLNNENTTKNDDLNLSYLGLKKEDNSFPKEYSCLNN